MTDKERLEEFREFIDFMYESIDLEDHQRFNAISESMLKDGWFKWIYKLAKEQAERVKGLEEENIQLNNEMEGLLQKIEDKEPYYSLKCLKLEQQNKRYREVLERQFGEFWEACVKVVGEDMAYDIVAEMPEECEE